MAFSLEAAIAVPVCIIAFSTSLVLAVPTYSRVETTAVLSAGVALKTANHKSLYKKHLLSCKDSYQTAIETSPDAILDLYRLGQDILQSFGSLNDYGELADGG